MTLDASIAPTGEIRRFTSWQWIFSLVLYMAIERLGTSFVGEGRQVSLVWPSAGVGLWLVATYGRGMLAAIALGEAARMILERNAPASSLASGALIGATNVLAAGLGAWLWQRSAAWWKNLEEDFRQPVNSILVATAVALWSASLGLLALALRSTPVAGAAAKWESWFASDFLGVVLVFPLLTALPKLNHLRAARGRQFLLGAGLFVLSTAAAARGFGWADNEIVLFALFPILLLATAQFGALGARAIAATVGAVAMVLNHPSRDLVTADLGRSASPPAHAEFFLGIVALVALALPPLHRRLNLVKRLPLALLLTGWIVSGGLFEYAESVNRRAEQQDFEQLAGNARLAIEQRITSNLEVLRSAASLLAVSPDIGRDRWIAFCDALDLRHRELSLGRLGAVFPVAPEDRESFIVRMRAEGAQDFTIHDIFGGPVGNRSKSFVIGYAANHAENRSAIGLDLATDPTQRATFETARDTDEPRVASLIREAGISPPRPTFLICVPVFRPGLPIATVAERRAALQAWVAGSFITEEFFASALGARAGRLQLHVFDQEQLDSAHLLYSSTPENPLPREFGLTNVRNVLGHEFTLCWNRGPQFNRRGQPPLAFIAVSFAVLTVFAGAWVASLQRLRDTADAIATARTTALRESEERFRGIFDNSPVIICILSVPDGRVIEANTAAEIAFGFTRATAIGRTTVELDVWVDLTLRQHYLDILARDGAVRAMEARMRRRDGTEFTALYSGTFIKIGGRPYSLNILQDITARKESEQARDHLLAITRATLESTADGILVVDLAGQIVTYNRLFAQMWGLPQEILDSRSDTGALQHAITLLEEPERFVEKVRALYAQPLAESFDTVRLKDGRVFERYSRPQLVNGQPTGRVWSFRDVSERLRAEEARAQLEATVRQAQKIESIGTLAGGIAHDFNNILTGIFGFIELARHELPSGHSAHSWLNQAYASSQRAKELVRQILTFSRRHSGERVRAELSLIVAEALRLLRSTLPANVELVWHFTPGCPPILADPTQIHQVVMNLCTNAWHSLPLRGGRISVSVERCDPPSELAQAHPTLGVSPAVRLSVVDNGCGMDAATQAQIFEPFFTTKETGQGTGLGLAVVHGIVATHGGAIQVRSTPGQGSAFEIYFPASAEPVQLAPAEPARPPPARGQHLLLVDDDPASRVALEYGLRSLDYHVTACDRPEDALKRFLATPTAFALVLTDFAMPGLNGGELAAQMLQRRPDLPVLLISGLITPREQAALLEAGIREIVHKPPALEEIAHAVARHLPK